jgi:hypothetical protein
MAQYITTDWVLAGADGRLLPRAAFLHAVAAGDLVHDGFALKPDHVASHGAAVVVVSGVAISEGRYKGQPFDTPERSTDLFIRDRGRWRCVFTQLTPLGPD